MSEMDSLTEFFYNIVPGSLFVVAFNFYLKPVVFNFLESNDPAKLFYLLICGLFFGFAFQGLTKGIRNICLNEKIFNRVKNDDKLSFKKAGQILKASGLMDGEKTSLSDHDKRAFYLMDNYLRGKGQAKTLQHFTARLAFWSNIFFGVLIIFLTDLYTIRSLYLPYLLMLFLFSAWLFWEYLRILYDSVLKTFVSVVNIKDGESLIEISRKFGAKKEISRN